MRDRVLSMISLSRAAGRIESGEFAAEKAVIEGAARLVIVSRDASDNTKKKFRDKTSYRGIPYREYGTKQELGGAIGKTERAIIALTDKGLAEALLKLL